MRGSIIRFGLAVGAGLGLHFILRAITSPSQNLNLSGPTGSTQLTSSEPYCGEPPAGSELPYVLCHYGPSTLQELLFWVGNIAVLILVGFSAARGPLVKPARGAAAGLLVAVIVLAAAMVEMSRSSGPYSVVNAATMFLLAALVASVLGYCGGHIARRVA